MDHLSAGDLFNISSTCLTGQAGNHGLTTRGFQLHSLSQVLQCFNPGGYLAKKFQLRSTGGTPCQGRLLTGMQSADPAVPPQPSSDLDRILLMLLKTWLLCRNMWS